MKLRAGAFMAFALATVAVAFAVPGTTRYENGWTKMLGRASVRSETELRIFCDGPHRVYVLLSDAERQSPSVVILNNGCLNWPKVQAEDPKQ